MCSKMNEGKNILRVWGTDDYSPPKGIASSPVALPQIHCDVSMCFSIYFHVWWSARERFFLWTPQVEFHQQVKTVEHNTQLLTHSPPPHSASRSFSLDAICPPWYSDALPESVVSPFSPSGSRLPPPCIFNGHTRAADKWFLFLTGEGLAPVTWGWGAREQARTQVRTAKNAHTTKERKSRMIL